MLKDRVAIVTGGARGLGLVMAESLGRQGAKIVLSDLDATACGDACQQLNAKGISCVCVHGNMASLEKADQLVKKTVGEYGRIDILINNAGGSANTPLQIEDVSEEDFARVMDWNVKATFFCTQRALPYLKMRGGSVINIASIAGRAGTELVSPQYSASKGAVIAMSRNLAKHLGPENVRVNVIAPGFIKSGPRAEGIWKKRDETSVLNAVALRRRGEPREIGDVALFLASDASSYITGAVLDVNGGFMTA